MKKIIYLLCLLCAVLLLVGCGGKEEEIPSEEDGITHYTAELRGIGTVSTHESELLFIESTGDPLPMGFKELDGVTVQTVCIIVNQDYPQIEEDFSFPIDWVIQRMLARIGIQGVLADNPFDWNEYLAAYYQPSDAECEATLEFNLTFNALSEQYESVGTRYTGAEVSGDMSMTVPGYEPVTYNLRSNMISPRSAILENQVDSWKTPAASPIDKVWQDLVIDGLYRLWGYPILIQSEAENLTEFRLILNNYLVMRTARNYGQDVDAWMEWYAQYDN